MEFAEFELGLDRQVFSMQDEYWIVDYQFCTRNNKVLRHVQPTKVFVFDKTKTSQPKWIISTKYYFRQIGKTGNPLTKTIQAYSYADKASHVFASEQEAEEFYKKQCGVVLENIRIARLEVLQKFNLLEEAAEIKLNACP